MDKFGAERFWGRKLGAPGKNIPGGRGGRVSPIGKEKTATIISGWRVCIKRGSLSRGCIEERGLSQITGEKLKSERGKGPRVKDAPQGGWRLRQYLLKVIFHKRKVRGIEPSNYRTMAGRNALTKFQKKVV